MTATRSGAIRGKRQDEQAPSHDDDGAKAEPR
jgi:hypothetical protein